MLNKPDSAASVAMNMALRDVFEREDGLTRSVKELEVRYAVRQVMGVYPKDLSEMPPVYEPENELVMRARLFAHTAHRGQKRKYTYEDYIVHPYAVARIVSCVPHDPAMLAAAWLHDVVEDCNVDILEIARLFGDDVCHLVSKLSDISTKEDGNRETRKTMDREWIATADPRAKTCKLADLIDNAHSIMSCDPQFAVNYLEEKRKLLGVLTEGNPILWKIADDICTQAGF
jgi:(p)ppGpp synthase/HD superfamily hydrolase